MKPTGPELVRSLTMWGVALLVVSSMIGSGVFKKVSSMALGLGSPALVLGCWLAAGVITLMGSLGNAEVASMFPEAGGQYVYFKKIFGRFFAFLYGWTIFSVVQSSSIASVGFVFAESMVNLLKTRMHVIEVSNLLPAGMVHWGIEGFHPFENLTVKLVTICMVWILVLVNIRGIKMGRWVSSVLATTIIISISVIVLMCFGFSGGSLSNLTHIPDGPRFYEQVHVPGKGIGGLHTPGGDQALSTAALAEHRATDVPPVGLIGALFAAMLAAFWAYDGWITIGYIGGEVKDANRTLPKGLVLGAVIVTAVYLLVHVAYLYARPIEWIADLTRIPNSIAAVELLGSFAGRGGMMFLSVLILCSTFNAANASVVAAPRVYYALARDGLFFNFIGDVHARFHTPYKALLLQGVWSSLLCLSGSFDMLTDMLIFAAFIFYGAGAVGVIALRHTMPNHPRPFKVPLYPYVPGLFALFSALLVVRTIMDRPMLAAKGVGLMLIGVPLYFYWNRKNPLPSQSDRDSGN